MSTCTYEERLATFISWPEPWPHTSPTSEDLAAAGFVRRTAKGYGSDNAGCLRCGINWDEWKSTDVPMTLHLNSYPCLLIKDIHKEASKPAIKSPQDLGFFDPTLQHDFPELRSYDNVYEFINHIQECKDRYREADILQMLPKCLRGPAYRWCRDLPESSDLRSPSRTLKMWLSALEIQFKKAEQTAESPQQIASQTAPGPSPQQSPHYHKCTACSASFSSLSRLLTHSQSDRCSKASCNHCDAIFDSKNKLHEHIREYHSAINSKAAKKFALAPLRGPENNSNGDHCCLKGGVDNKELTSLSSESTTATPICSANPVSASEISATPPPTYRSISPAPPTYQTTKPRGYLTIDDLFMRYAPLQRIKLDHAVRPISKVLPTMTIQDLYHRFEKQQKQRGKSIMTHIKQQEKPKLSQAKLQRDISSISMPEKRHSGTAIWTPCSPVIKCSNPAAKSHAKTSIWTPKPRSAKASISQRQHYLTSTAQAPLGHILDSNLRGHTSSSLGLIVAVDRLARLHSISQGTPPKDRLTLK